MEEGRRAPARLADKISDEEVATVTPRSSEPSLNYASGNDAGREAPDDEPTGERQQANQADQRQR